MGTHPIFESDFDCLTDMESTAQSDESSYHNNFSDGAQIQAEPMTAITTPPVPPPAAPKVEPVAQTLLPEVEARLEQIYEVGVIERDGIEKYCMDRLRNLNPEHGVAALSEYENIYRSGRIEKPSGFLTNIIGCHQNAQDANMPASNTVYHVPPVEPILELKERHGFELDISTGQRKLSYGSDSPPPHKDECFIGGLLREAFEPEICEMLENANLNLHELRLMMGYDGKSRGFAFASFKDEDGCRQCKEKLDGCEILGKKIVVNVSTPATRLFVGSIAKDKSREDFLAEFEKIGGTNVTDIIMSEPQEHGKNENAPSHWVNRGFMFVDFATHIDACEFKKKMQLRLIAPFGKPLPNVDWAEPIVKPDEDALAKVKNVYAVGWCETRTEEEITQLFEPFGMVEKVKKINNYSFIHYSKREQALASIEAMNGKEISPGEVITCTIAKPSENNQQNRRRRGGWNQFGGYHGGYQAPYHGPPHGGYNNFGGPGAYGGNFGPPRGPPGFRGGYRGGGFGHFGGGPRPKRPRF